MERRDKNQVCLGPTVPGTQFPPQATSRVIPTNLNGTTSEYQGTKTSEKISLLWQKKTQMKSNEMANANYTNQI